MLSCLVSRHFSSSILRSTRRPALHPCQAEKRYAMCAIRSASALLALGLVFVAAGMSLCTSRPCKNACPCINHRSPGTVTCPGCRSQNAGIAEAAPVNVPAGRKWIKLVGRDSCRGSSGEQARDVSRWGREEADAMVVWPGFLLVHHRLAPASIQLIREVNFGDGD